MKKFPFLLSVFILFLFVTTNAAAKNQNALNKELYKAVGKENLKNVKKALAEGADINAREGALGWTPLMKSLFWKSTKERKEIFFYLLQNGADVKARNDHQGTALHVAVPFDNRTEEIEALLKAGADINAQNENGTTSLHTAVFCNSNDVVALLIKNKAGVNIQNKDGETPLMIACQDKKSVPIVEMLINAKADLDLKNKKGETALMIAKKKNIKGAVDLLVKAGAKE